MIFREKAVRILFCGDYFPASHSLLKERLRAEDEIVVCDGINLRNALANCDVVIPMMTILDEALMEAGSFRLVQQRSEEHTSELQSRGHLVCRLLLEKKKR